MNVYLSGGTGFIGSYVALELASHGHTVNILARNPDKVPALKKVKNINMIQCDISNHGKTEKCIKKPDALVHIALCWGDTAPEMILNEAYTSVKLIDTAVKKGASRIIFTSSTSATGYSYKNAREDSYLLPPDNYGATKGAVELFMHAYAVKNPNIAFNIIRPGYTFGNPAINGGAMEPDSRFRKICSMAKEGKTITVIKNDGTQFIWAGHLALLYRKLLESKFKNEVFFGLSKNFISWEQIANWAVSFSGSKSVIKTADKGYSAKPSLFNVNKMKKYFGLSFNNCARIKEHIKYLLKN